MRFKGINLYIVIIGAIIVLSACNGPSTQEKMYDHLEESVHLEAEFEEIQEQIVGLEAKEQEIYNQIHDLGKDEMEEIKKLSEEAIESIKERSSLIASEKESISASQQEFEKVKELIEELDEQAMKDKAEEMYKVMMDRYEAYDQLHETYVETLEQEEALYLLFQNDELEQEELSDQITLINASYEKFLDENKNFNEATASYNVLKEEFYHVADLEVEFEED